MYLFLKLVLLYPYPHQTFAVTVTIVIVIILGLPLYFLYQAIIDAMTERTRAIFYRVLKITGICLIVIISAEMTVSLITQHQVNKQLGFNYATPDTQEGEIFEITRVDAGKTMETSGLKLYDRVQMSSVGELYKLLINNQGKEVTFLVLRNKKKTEICIKVPEMELPLRKFSFCY